MTRGEAMAVVSIMGGSSIPGDGLTVSGGGERVPPLYGGQGIKKGEQWEAFALGYNQDLPWFS